MNGSGVTINGDSRGESRQSSARNPCISSPSPRCTLSSRLPVPRKVSSSIPPPITIGSLRPSASKESLSSGRLPKASPPRGTPTIAKRNSLIGINTTASALDSPGSPSIRTPRRPNFGGTDYTSHTTTSLAKRTSIPSLTRKPSNSSLSRKSSSSQLHSVTVSTPPRRVSGVNGNVAPPLTRKPSASQLHLSKRPSVSQLARKTSTPQLNTPVIATPSPTPLRRVVSSNLPSLRPPTMSKIPPRPSLSPLRQPSSSNGPRPLTKTRKPAARSKAPPVESPPKKVPGAYKVASQALRDTIAKARAAHRANVLANATKPPTPTTSEPVGNGLDGFNFSTDDSSNQVIFGEGGSESVNAHQEDQGFLPVVSIAFAEPVEPIEPADSVDPTEPVEPVQPVEPVEPAEPVELVEPVGPVEPVEPAEPAEPAEPSEPFEPIVSRDPVKLGDPIDLGDAAVPREE